MEYGVWIKLHNEEPRFLKSEHYSVHQRKEDCMGKTQPICGGDNEFIYKMLIRKH